MLDQKTFICKRCGECCIKYTVRLNKSDAERIKKAGYGEKGFIEIDKHLSAPNKSVLKKKDNKWCVFLTKDKEGVFSCSIYDARPFICKKYPFLKKNIESCKPVTFLNHR